MFCYIYITVNNCEILYSSPELAVMFILDIFFVIFYIDLVQIEISLSQGIRYKVSYALSFFIVIFIL